MDYDYSELLEDVRHWAEQAVAERRLARQAAQGVLDKNCGSPDSLFCGQPADAGRPLIVGFMGGTGVGKSSLLNRLAGETIAKAGVERPTSREVTLFLHQSLSLQQLSGDLPLDKLKISRHRDAANRGVVWMDMPDFDSIEHGNQRMVLEWLPHIDVLLYVVSPERYRDNKAWQLLLAEGVKHAWIFVMNQCDIGSSIQLEDFKRQLYKAGFADPLVYRTSCTEPVGDDFADLVRQIQALSTQQNVSRLEQYQCQLQWRSLKQCLQTMFDELNDRDFRRLGIFYADIWRNAETGLQHGLAWTMQALAQFLAEHPGTKPDIKLWDEWAQSRFDDILDEVLLQAVQLNIPNHPLKVGLQLIKIQAEKKIAHIAELSAKESLLNPGNAVQRLGMRLAAIAETLLPLAAMAVVGYQVFVGYYRSVAGGTYLGADFAIHSLLLIGLSWLIPFFLHKRIRPSQQKAALQGLERGLQKGLSALDLEIKALLAAEEDRNRALLQELTGMIGRCEQTTVEIEPGEDWFNRIIVVE